MAKIRAKGANYLVKVLNGIDHIEFCQFIIIFKVQ